MAPALALALAPIASTASPDDPYAGVAAVPAVRPAPAAATDGLLERAQRKIAAMRPHLTDPTMDDSEVLHTALKLYDWFLRRHAQGYRVQLVNEDDATTEVDLIL